MLLLRRLQTHTSHLRLRAEKMHVGWCRNGTSLAGLVCHLSELFPLGSLNHISKFLVGSRVEVLLLNLQLEEEEGWQDEGKSLWVFVKQSPGRDLAANW